MPTFLSAKTPARPDVFKVTVSPEMALMTPPEITAVRDASYVLLAAVAPVTCKFSGVMLAVTPVGWTKA